MKLKQALTVFSLTDAATDKELQLAYRKGVKQWHPDRFCQEPEPRRQQAEQKMRELNMAFELLTEHYRQHGHFREVYQPRTVIIPPATTPTHSQSESQDTEADFVIPKKQAARGSIWLAVILSLIAGYFLFTGQQEEQHAAVQQSHSGAKFKPTKNNEEASAELTKPGQDTAEPDTVAADRDSSAELLSRFKKPEARKKEDKSAFETRSVFTKEEQPVKEEAFFTYGDTIGKVYEVQGIPSRTEGDTWYYGESVVQFKDGRVVAFENSGNPMLKVRF